MPDADAAKDAVEQASRKLSLAWRSRTACDPVRPLIEAHGLDAAYAVQRAMIETALAAGRRVTGRKIGLTAPAVQKQLGVGQPDYGVLLDDMECGDALEIPLSRLIQPKVEAEIAFVLERDLDMDVPAFGDVLRAIAFAVPAIEVVDSRVRDWAISIYDTIADNASAGLYVLGATARKLEQLDLRLCGMVIENRGEPVSNGCGAACLGNPLNALVWLARRMGALGKPLRAGEVILSGALGPMAAVQPGEAYEARISGLGSVSAVFSKE